MIHNNHITVAKCDSEGVWMVVGDETWLCEEEFDKIISQIKQPTIV